MLRRSLKDLLRVELNEETLEKLEWKDFQNGLAMARLAREGKQELVIYRVRDGASPDAFLKHEHLGGEFYLVLKGAIGDETGIYRAGDIVYLEPNSIHTPRAEGETVVLVLWPGGVRIVDERK
jgi:anti-sigma factor ChrR (cupin superfamily)